MSPRVLVPFDFVAGNPPWINWQNFPEGYHKETMDLWAQHATTSRGAGQPTAILSTIRGVGRELAAVLKVLVPLLLGFALNSASAFTTAFSRRWGESRGRLATFVLRNVVGIPVWVAGLILAVRSPSSPVFDTTVATDTLGWVLLGLGSAVQILALAALQWKAARPSVGDELVARGVYAYVRHPIYAGVLLDFAAVVLLKPKQTVVVAVVLGCVWVLVQAWLEEVDLVQRMPAYREYMKRVPRFLPSLAPKAKA